MVPFLPHSSRGLPARAVSVFPRLHPHNPEDVLGLHERVILQVPQGFLPGRVDLWLIWFDRNPAQDFIGHGTPSSFCRLPREKCKTERIVPRLLSRLGICLGLSYALCPEGRSMKRNGLHGHSMASTGYVSSPAPLAPPESCP